MEAFRHALFPLLFLSTLASSLLQSRAISVSSLRFRAPRATRSYVPEVFDFRICLEEVLARLERSFGQLEPYPIPNDLCFAETSPGMRGAPIIRTEVVGFSGGPIRQVRAATIRPLDDSAPAPRVLNLVIFPHTWLNLPVFGADLVTLPGGSLVLVDLHPMTDLASHGAQVGPTVSQLHARYQGARQGDSADPLPWGGDLPTEALPFMSPWRVWTRLPSGQAGADVLAGQVSPLIRDYLDAWISLAEAAWEGAGRGKGVVSSDFETAAGHSQRAYSRYRAEKDPARAMLTRMHGADFTERLIHEVLFDFEHAEARHKDAAKR